MIEKICESCKTQFNVKEGEEWKSVCKKCYAIKKKAEEKPENKEAKEGQQIDKALDSLEKSPPRVYYIDPETLERECIEIAKRLVKDYAKEEIFLDINQMIDRLRRTKLAQLIK